MANNYVQHAANQTLIGSKEVFDILFKALNETAGEDDEEFYHGFTLEFYPIADNPDTGEIYLYAEECGSEGELPQCFLEALGGLIETNKLPYLEIGFSITCDKMRVGEFGGGSYRINTKGEIIYPEIIWPK